MPAKSERDIEPSAVPAPAASSRDANARDPVRLAALRETELLDTSAEERFDRLTRLAARIVGVPSSFISLVDAERDFYKSAWGHGVPIAPQGSVSGRTLCHDAIQRREPLVISDTANDPTYRDSPIAREIGIGAYVGIPLIVNGEAIGAFCAMDVEPRQWSTDDIEVLEALASAACREMERRSAHFIIDAATTALKSREQELLESNEQLQGVATELEAQTEELQATTMELEERAVELQAVARRARFAGAVGHAIISGNALPQVLQHCCEAAVDHLMAAFARVWLLDESEPVLMLTASAGMYTHLDGPHGRVPVGQFKIGKIAAERAPHLTNSVIGDPRIPAQEWAKKEGMVAFAGYPLIVADEVVGVIAMFSRESLTDADFEALGTSATAISVTIRNAANFRAGDRARKSAEVANRSKADFLTVMSHELRTPLNAIGGYTEILELGVHGPINDAQKAALDRIQRSQRHLLGLINGILNFAKVDAGAVEYELERVLLSDVIASSEALIAPQARSKSLDLRIERDGVSPAVIADREKTQQILLNLLSNAIKFTDAGGTIGIQCGLSSNSSAEIRVTDSGRGIAEGELDRVFQPFVQIDATLTRTKEGTGLGLSISRDLARGMKGDLRAASELGKGSTFTLTLPLAPN